jgi:phosphoserine phosphatase
MGGIDFYDVDHTLVRGTSGVRFLLMGVRRRLFPAVAAFYIPLILFRYRLGLIGGDFGKRVFRGLRGRNREALASLARESYLAVRRRIYPGARELVAQRKASGRRAVLATSSIDVIVRPLAEEIGRASCRERVYRLV